MIRDVSAAGSARRASGLAALVFAAAVGLAGLAGWAPEAAAFEQWSINRTSGNCADCHGNFRQAGYTSKKDGTTWGTSLHDGHRTTMLTGDCNACHSGPSRFPVFLNFSNGGTGLEPISCVGCHGRTEDLNNGQIGAGLRQHHTNSGAAFCGGCHQDNDPATFTTVAENMPPPYYFIPDAAHPNKPTDACDGNGSQSVFGMTGLGNDGDLLDDATDFDCGADARPVADANGPYTGSVNVPVTFDGTGSSDDGTIVAYDWDFGDGNVGMGPTPTHTYAAVGMYTVSLTVIDDDGLIDSDNTTATIGPECLPPVADPNGPYVGTVNVPVQFDGSGSSDPCDAPLAYDWDFGDGNTGTGASPMHTYTADGPYSVTLTVTNDAGETDSASTTATITDGPPMAVVMLKVPGAINPENNGVTPIKFWADMLDLEIAFVECGPAAAEPERLNMEDVNADGYGDVVGLFETRALGIACGGETLTCMGTLADGTTFESVSEPFKTVGRACKPGNVLAKRGNPAAR